MKNEIIGLNLLFLIVENRMADFHSEVSLVAYYSPSDVCLSDRSMLYALCPSARASL